MWAGIASGSKCSLQSIRRKIQPLENGIFQFPVATKKCSISIANEEADFDEILSITEHGLNSID